MGLSRGAPRHVEDDRRRALCAAWPHRRAGTLGACKDVALAVADDDGRMGATAVNAK